MDFHIESFRDYCLSKPHTTEEFPFDQTTLVFKVHGKIFAMTDVFEFDGINLKCNPEKAIELRNLYDGIKPGYHANKKHWNTIYFPSDVPQKIIWELIDHSYECVWNGLPKSLRIPA
jgi:predicted DNA-binding protein (MmcQ/YjbR family)